MIQRQSNMQTVSLCDGKAFQSSQIFNSIKNVVEIDINENEDRTSNAIHCTCICKECFKNKPFDCAMEFEVIVITENQNYKKSYVFTKNENVSDLASFVLETIKSLCGDVSILTIDSNNNTSTCDEDSNKDSRQINETENDATEMSFDNWDDNQDSFAETSEAIHLDVRVAKDSQKCLAESKSDFVKIVVVNKQDLSQVIENSRNVLEEPKEMQYTSRLQDKRLLHATEIPRKSSSITEGMNVRKYALDSNEKIIKDIFDTTNTLHSKKEQRDSKYLAMLHDSAYKPQKDIHNREYRSLSVKYNYKTSATYSSGAKIINHGNTKTEYDTGYSDQLDITSEIDSECKSIDHHLDLEETNSRMKLKFGRILILGGNTSDKNREIALHDQASKDHKRIMQGVEETINNEEFHSTPYYEYSEQLDITSEISSPVEFPYVKDMDDLHEISSGMILDIGRELISSDRVEQEFISLPEVSPEQTRGLDEVTSLLHFQSEFEYMERLKRTTMKVDPNIGFSDHDSCIKEDNVSKTCTGKGQELFIKSRSSENAEWTMQTDIINDRLQMDPKHFLQLKPQTSLDKMVTTTKKMKEYSYIDQTQSKKSHQEHDLCDKTDVLPTSRMELVSDHSHDITDSIKEGQQVQDIKVQPDMNNEFICDKVDKTEEEADEDDIINYTLGLDRPESIAIVELVKTWTFENACMIDDLLTAIASISYENNNMVDTKNILKQAVKFHINTVVEADIAEEIDELMEDLRSDIVEWSDVCGSGTTSSTSTDMHLYSEISSCLIVSTSSSRCSLKIVHDKLREENLHLTWTFHQDSTKLYQRRGGKLVDVVRLENTEINESSTGESSDVRLQLKETDLQVEDIENPPLLEEELDSLTFENTTVIDNMVTLKAGISYENNQLVEVKSIVPKKVEQFVSSFDSNIVEEVEHLDKLVCEKFVVVIEENKMINFKDRIRYVCPVIELFDNPYLESHIFTPSSAVEEATVLIERNNISEAIQTRSSSQESYVSLQSVRILLPEKLNPLRLDTTNFKAKITNESDNLIKGDAIYASKAVSYTASIDLNLSDKLDKIDNMLKHHQASIIKEIDSPIRYNAVKRLQLIFHVHAFNLEVGEGVDLFVIDFERDTPNITKVLNNLLNMRNITVLNLTTIHRKIKQDNKKVRETHKNIITKVNGTKLLPPGKRIEETTRKADHKYDRKPQLSPKASQKSKIERQVPIRYVPLFEKNVGNSRALSGFRLRHYDQETSMFGDIPRSRSSNDGIVKVCHCLKWLEKSDNYDALYPLCHEHAQEVQREIHPGHFNGFNDDLCKRHDEEMRFGKPIRCHCIIACGIHQVMQAINLGLDIHSMCSEHEDEIRSLQASSSNLHFHSHALLSRRICRLHDNQMKEAINTFLKKGSSVVEDICRRKNNFDDFSDKQKLFSSKLEATKICFNCSDTATSGLRNEYIENKTDGSLDQISTNICQVDEDLHTNNQGDYKIKELRSETSPSRFETVNQLNYKKIISARVELHKQADNIGIGFSTLSQPISSKKCL